MGDFRRLVETYGEVIDIIKPVTHLDGGSIVTIYKNDPTTNARRYLPADSNSLCNAYIKSLFLYAEINSLSEAPFPEILATDSAAQKAQKALNIEWGGQRYRLDLFKKKAGTGWLPIGAVSLINPSGYPYRTYNLQDIFTNALAVEVAEGTEIGCKVTDCGWEYLKSNDQVVIHGSVSEEVAVIESNSVLPPGVSLGNLAFQDKENVYIKNGIIEALSQALPIAAGGTGVNTIELLKALVKQNPLISEIEGLDTLIAGKPLRLNNAGNAIISVTTPIWSNITLANSWTNVSGFTAKYRQWASGLVEIRGVITRATAPAANSTVFSIPTDLAPDTPIGSYQQALNINSILALSLGSTGNVIFVSGTATAQNSFHFCYMAG